VKSVRRPRAIILDTTDRNGFFDPEKVADLLDWTPDEVRRYLDQQPSSIPKSVTVSATHVRLHSLATLIQEVFELMHEDIYEIRAWFQAPIKALDGRSPRDMILAGELERVSALVDETAGGFAF
jgi:hypothetical protein